MEARTGTTQALQRLEVFDSQAEAKKNVLQAKR
jgi:hypothetical protein